MIGCVAKMEVNYQKSKIKGSNKVFALQKSLTELNISTNLDSQKIQLLVEFEKNYKNTNQILSKEILDLQYDFLKIITNSYK